MNSSEHRFSWGQSMSSVQETRILQSIWDFIRNKEGWLKSPFFPVIFSATVYMAFCFPFILMDIMCIKKITPLRKYKIQPNIIPTKDMMTVCVAQTVYNHIVFIFPITVAHWYWRCISLPPSAPEVREVIFDVIGCLLLFDFQYFVWHLLHHKIPWLYKTFHKAHHKYTATFALTTEHSSAWEILSLGFFAAINPMLLKCHPLTETIFFIVNIWLSVEDHSGYDFPWSTHRLLPYGLYGGAPHHDLHHMKFRSNYAPYFTHWDKLFGTFSQLPSK
ncbi:cholesterol 25-hydroxylase-like protein [Protopterus annectens]|uniref:cholesterol 25-hydroxylase-like protein n=1 Tax=Protopterus annectens TaxID=7888 RepID=UPI001CFB5545|nr:cholesterol 25-hydroxylase-like protein [Protopterus annectens]